MSFSSCCGPSACLQDGAAPSDGVLGWRAVLCALRRAGRRACLRARAGGGAQEGRGGGAAAAHQDGTRGGPLARLPAPARFCSFARASTLVAGMLGWLARSCRRRRRKPRRRRTASAPRRAASRTPPRASSAPRVSVRLDAPSAPLPTPRRLAPRLPRALCSRRSFVRAHADLARGYLDLQRKGLARMRKGNDQTDEKAEWVWLVEPSDPKAGGKATILYNRKAASLHWLQIKDDLVSPRRLFSPASLFSLFSNRRSRTTSITVVRFARRRS